MNATESKTTTEGLQMKADSYGAVLAHGDYTLASFYTWKKGEGYGNDAKVYRLAEQPGSPWRDGEKSRNECALELIDEADHLFEDAGHAIAWALTQI